MKPPQWTAGLSVGHALLDEHHQTLFDLLGELDDGIELGRDEHWAQGLKARLLDYISYHFREEEAALEAVDYPFLQFHRASHQAISMRMHALLDGLGTRPLPQVLGEVRTFLSDWLAHHIEIEDFEYKPYLGAAG